MKAILIENIVVGEVAMYSNRDLYPKKKGMYVFDDGVVYTLVDVADTVVSYIGSIPRIAIIKELVITPLATNTIVVSET